MPMRKLFVVIGLLSLLVLAACKPRAAPETPAPEIVPVPVVPEVREPVTAEPEALPELDTGDLDALDKDFDSLKSLD